MIHLSHGIKIANDHFEVLLLFLLPCILVLLIFFTDLRADKWMLLDHPLRHLRWGWKTRRFLLNFWLRYSSLIIKYNRRISIFLIIFCLATKTKYNSLGDQTNDKNMMKSCKPEILSGRRSYSSEQKSRRDTLLFKKKLESIRDYLDLLENDPEKAKAT